MNKNEHIIFLIEKIMKKITHSIKLISINKKKEELEYTLLGKYLLIKELFEHSNGK